MPTPCRLLAVLTLAALPGALRADEPRLAPVEFNRDIRPILSDTCYTCHGPAKSTRKGGLRLDTETGLFGDLGGYHAIVPGKPGQSELLRRILSKDAKERMPPASSGRHLTPGQVELLRRWVAEGAKWQKHWSLLPPRRPDLPAVNDPRWPRNPIDHFVLARLEREGLKPSPEADRITLLRRVALDLTGLPPTPAEVDAFLADRSPDAYEKAVERLLKSPRYGERMAIKWLEAARYADTNGYQTDGERTMWRWRDWVIESFNDNMPFDRFTIEQLAGDMLPRPTLEQRIATGFNRNHRGNSEGGVIPEEYAVEYVVDRVDTTATVWLGLTMGCAKCHDHKYDPVTQKEFYQVFAYFNNVPEKGKAIKYGNSPPMIKAPTRGQRAELGRLQADLRVAEGRFRALRPWLAAAQAEWEKAGAKWKEGLDELPSGLITHFPLDGDTLDRRSPWFLSFCGYCRQTLPKREATFRGGAPAYAPGPFARPMEPIDKPSKKAADFDGKRYLDAGDLGDFGFFDKFTLSAWVYPAGKHGGTILSRMADTARAEGYSLSLEGGKVHFNLVKRWLDDAIRVETVQALTPGRWQHITAAYDGSRLASGIRICVNGDPVKLEVNLDDLNQSFRTKAPLRIGAGGGAQSRFRGRIADVRIHNRALAPEEVELLATRESLPDILALPPQKRTPRQTAKLRAYFLEFAAPESIRRSWRQLQEMRGQLEKLHERTPTTMVMEEMLTPRDTHILIRGEYDKKGPKVTPGLPASLPPLPPGAPNNRLGFARWLVDPANPLTARVAVNRYWQLYFGTGLVKTTEDFGAQSEWPSHPELLDWLATEFVRTGWDVKAMQRLIVTSSTYRQSSKVTADLRQRDPDNRLLARGPRLRLSAEMIRDQALAASGLLVERLGGPSVRPYQPPGLWRELTNEGYEQDHGEKLYRRSLYTFWKRTIAPPAMLTFDAPGREACAVKQTRTNTPLQALNLLNDVTYVEAARALAERVLREAGPTPEGRLTLAFRLATARPPRPAELKILREGLDVYLAQYRADRAAALKLVSAGESRRDGRLEVSELAAYTAAASLILNLDETITKE